MITAGIREASAVGARRAVNFEGWLFDAREFEPFLKPTAADLDAIVTGLTTTAEACAGLGLRYLPVLIPAKRNTTAAAPATDRSWIAELNARLRDVDDVELMNLLSVLRHASRHGRCYHRTDADWNDLGAFFIARALLKEAHKTVPALRPAPLDDLHLRSIPAYRGTLIDAPMLQLLDGELVDCEGDVDLEPNVEEGTVLDASRLLARRMPVESHLASAGGAPMRVYANPERHQDACIAVAGDAAALPVVVWIAECARRVTFFSSRALPLSQLELELPKVVIHFVRETDLLAGRESPGAGRCLFPAGERRQGGAGEPAVKIG